MPSNLLLCLGHFEFQEPEGIDAKGILELNQQLLQNPETGFEVDHINAFLQAGAAWEVNEALDLRHKMIGEDPFVGAIRVEVSCWDPLTREQALRLSHEWMDMHSDSSLNEYVTVRRDWLEEESVHKVSVGNKEAFARGFPAVALLGALLICWITSGALFRWEKKRKEAPYWVPPF